MPEISIIEQLLENKTSLPGNVPNLENQVLLNQMNGLFDAFINQFPHAAIVETADNKIIFINEHFCQLFNIPLPAYELVGKDHSLIEKLTEDIIAHADTFFSELSQIISAQITRKEITVELIDGRVFQLDFLPLLLQNQYVGHTLLFKNITDEILANKRLQAQQRLFETILNKLPVDVAVFSPDFSDLFLNPIAIKDTEMRKWMLDWLIGKDMHPHTRIPLNNAGNRRYFNQVLQTKNLVSWEEERENLTTNITEYYLRNMFPVLDEWGEIIMVIGYNINITDRKVAEEKIKISEKKYRDLINYSNTLICTHKLSGEILTVNPAVSLLLKYTKNEMVGNLVQKFLTEKGRDKFESDYIQKVVGKGSSSGVFSIVSKNNEKFYLLFQNYIVFEDAEEPYIVLFAQDITDRIRAEKELLLAKKLTEEAALAKEAFLANMSHEIRTPMNGILGISSFLKKTTLSQQQQEYLQLIIDSANNLLVIVNDVLDIEKIASGKLQLEHIPFKFLDKLKSAVQAFQYKAEEKGLQLVFNAYLPNDMVVIGDPYRMIQIINNLLNNAIKFTHEGQVAVAARLLPDKLNQEAVNIIVTVTDTGIGIPESRINEIFKPFVQGAADTTRKYGGTGLGLSICKNLVDMLKGSINISSTEGSGTTFTITLPYLIGSETDLPATNEQELVYAGLENIKVLVAEDVELNQYLAKTLLESWGCEVTLAQNGLVALQQLESKTFDIILMDVHMPEMDGIMATKAIRQLNNQQKANIPIIALTANALKGTEDVYLDAGMNGYISKPYTEKNMFTAICELLQIPVTYKLNKTATANNSKTTITEDDAVLYDAQLLHKMSKGKTDFVQRMVSIFYKNTPDDLAKLANAINNTDWDLTGKMAHRMKPSIDGMGIYALKEVIRTIERNAKEKNNVSAIPGLFEKVNNHLQKVLEQLKIDFNL